MFWSCMYICDIRCTTSHVPSERQAKHNGQYLVGFGCVMLKIKYVWGGEWEYSYPRNVWLSYLPCMEKPSLAFQLDSCPVRCMLFAVIWKRHTKNWRMFISISLFEILWFSLLKKVNIIIHNWPILYFHGSLQILQLIARILLFSKVSLEPI